MMNNIFYRLFSNLIENLWQDWGRAKEMIVWVSVLTYHVRFTEYESSVIWKKKKTTKKKKKKKQRARDFLVGVSLPEFINFLTHYLLKNKKKWLSTSNIVHSITSNL